MAPNSYEDSYAYLRETEPRNDTTSPFRQMSQLSLRQQRHIHDLTELLSKQRARLIKTERELARQKEKRSSEMSEIKLLRRQVENQQSPSSNRSKPHRSRNAITPAREERYQRWEEQVGNVKDSYTQERIRQNSKDDTYHSSHRSCGCPPKLTASFERQATDPHVKGRENNERWRHGMSANRNYGFAQQEVSQAREGYEVRRERRAVGKLGKPARTIPAGLAAAAAREQGRFGDD